MSDSRKPAAEWADIETREVAEETIEPTFSHKSYGFTYRPGKSPALETREAAEEAYSERVARDLEQCTGEESPAIKLLREWKAGRPDREWTVEEDFEQRGIIVGLRQGDYQRSILIPWPSPMLSYESASRATAAKVSDLIGMIAKACEPALFQAAEPEEAPPLDVPTSPEPRETEG